jgi:hypothetical protein
VEIETDVLEDSDCAHTGYADAIKAAKTKTRRRDLDVVIMFKVVPVVFYATSMVRRYRLKKGYVSNCKSSVLNCIIP